MKRMLQYIEMFRHPDTCNTAEFDGQFLDDLLNTGLADDDWKSVLDTYDVSIPRVLEEGYRRRLVATADTRLLGAIMLLYYQYCTMLQCAHLAVLREYFLFALERLQEILEEDRNVTAFSITTDNFKAYGQETDIREYIRVSSDGILVQRRSRQGDDIPYYEEHFVCDRQAVECFFQKLTREYFIQSYKSDYRPYGQNGRYWKAHIHFRESHGIVVYGAAILPPYAHHIMEDVIALAEYRYIPWEY